MLRNATSDTRIYTPTINVEIEVFGQKQNLTHNRGDITKFSRNVVENAQVPDLPCYVW